MEIHIAIAPETLFTVGPLRVTNSLFMMFVVMGLLLIVGTENVPSTVPSLFNRETHRLVDGGSLMNCGKPPTITLPSGCTPTVWTPV